MVGAEAPLQVTLRIGGPAGFGEKVNARVLWPGALVVVVVGVDVVTDVVVLVDWTVVVGGVGMDVRTIENVSGLAPPHASMWPPGVQFTLPVESGPA